MNKLLGITVAVLGLSGPLVASASAQTSNTETYTPGGDLATLCGTPSGDLGIGGGCFALGAGATSVQASLKDAVTSDTSGDVRFQDAGGNTLGSVVSFCGSSPQIPVPAGTARVFVWADGPLLNATVAGCGPASFATSGTVTLTQFP